MTFFYFKFGILEFLGIGNLQKKFDGSNSKIVDFSLMSNFCQLLPWSKKQNSDLQKLDIGKKSTIFEIEPPNFCCKLSIPKNPSIPNLEVKFSRLLKETFTFVLGGGAILYQPPCTINLAPCCLIWLQQSSKSGDCCMKDKKKKNVSINVTYWWTLTWTAEISDFDNFDMTNSH